MVTTRLNDATPFLASAAEQVRRQMEARIGDLRCEEHEREPDVVIESTPSGGLGVHLDACCTPFGERVRVLLGIERVEG